jgi:excinuclease ABC subunit B
MDKFKLVSLFKPKGDQPQAIKSLVVGLESGQRYQVLLGVTGSGKTFTIANVIEKTQLPTLIISHNKTLAAQLYQELKEFFPQNPVSYFVSYYDYYQPEAYLPSSDTYISKEVDINPLIDQLRLQATANIFSYSKSIVIASVSCIYNIGAPQTYEKKTFLLKKDNKIDLTAAQDKLVDLYYQKSLTDFLPGTFRQRGDRLDIFLPYFEDEVLKIYFKSAKVLKLELENIITGKSEAKDSFAVYPAKHYLTGFDNLDSIFKAIKKEAGQQAEYFKSQGRDIEAYRIEKKVNFDLQMIKEAGYVNGIENYSRYFDGRAPGQAPYSLLDYFKFKFKDKFLVVIDESHVTVPQIRGMYNGDKSRKQTLIDFGFRLPSALDNRPLKFGEVLTRIPKAVYVSATPSDWEKKKSQGRVIEQIIRPTGLVDPAITVRPAESQIPDLIKRIKEKKQQGQRVLVITLTKRLAEDLAAYLSDSRKTNSDLKVTYLHAEIDTLKRSDVLTDLRSGNFDVLVGINLLREGLDLPEVGLVAILEADKQGFLRSKTSLIQIMGRAARNIAGEVVLYAEETSTAMKQAMQEVKRRRKKQLEYNKKHNITPKSIKKAIRPRIIKEEKEKEKEVDFNQLTPEARKDLQKKLERKMRQAARDLDFEQAAKLRDRIKALKNYT